MSDRLATKLRLVHPRPTPRPSVEAAWRAAGRAFLFAVLNNAHDDDLRLLAHELYRARDRLLSEGDLP